MTPQERETIKNIKDNIQSVVSVSVFNKGKGIASKTFLDGGSGFIIDKEGIVVTSVHVIHRDGLFYEIATSENKKYEADIIETDLRDRKSTV